MNTVKIDEKIYGVARGVIYSIRKKKSYNEVV